MARHLSVLELHRRKVNRITGLAVLLILLVVGAGVWFFYTPYLEADRRRRESELGMIDLWSFNTTFVVKREVTGQFAYQDFAPLGVRYWVVEAEDRPPIVVLTIPGQVQTEVGATVKVVMRLPHCKFQAASEPRGCDYSVVVESQTPTR